MFDSEPRRGKADVDPYVCHTGTENKICQRGSGWDRIVVIVDAKGTKQSFAFQKLLNDTRKTMEMELQGKEMFKVS